VEAARRQPNSFLDQPSRGGVEFIDENGGGPGVRLKKPLKKRS
jgi:hypothetical protein